MHNTFAILQTIHAVSFTNILSVNLSILLLKILTEANIDIDNKDQKDYLDRILFIERLNTVSFGSYKVNLLAEALQFKRKFAQLRS
ncbi:hypothetical protein FGO68_gene269 [Halteria grandinella]|uniref:Uncharacterized protein n=1 Tax=Halteria grandinella TaxID=5974 RepID=A0A8J8T893_HALGN|nr:hypothetical protein FGO68_gene269 [Halteria grandinella]